MSPDNSRASHIELYIIAVRSAEGIALFSPSGDVNSSENRTRRKAAAGDAGTSVDKLLKRTPTPSKTRRAAPLRRCVVVVDDADDDDEEEEEDDVAGRDRCGGAVAFAAIGREGFAIGGVDAGADDDDDDDDRAGRGAAAAPPSPNRRSRASLIASFASSGAACVDKVDVGGGTTLADDDTADEVDDGGT
jgi:hypothetical protein